MPDLPVNTWIDKNASRLAAGGGLTKGRSNRNGDPVAKEALALLLRQLHEQEILNRMGPSYREGQNVPGRSQWQGGMLPAPGEIDEVVREHDPGSAWDGSPQQMYDAFVTGHDRDT